MKKKNKKNNYQNAEKIVIVSFILLLLIVLIFISRNFRNFSNITLMKNKKDIFTIKDLSVNNVKYFDDEEDIVKEFGKPIKVSKKSDNYGNYKIYKYKGLELTMLEYGNTYILSEAKVTSRKYKTSRNIRVGNSITKVFNKYKVKYAKSDYMYGNYQKDALDSKMVKKDIYYGYRDKTKVEYIVRDEIANENVKVPIAKITYEYKHGKVKSITWSYTNNY